MGKIISPEKKKEILPFIKSNFDKISQREIARRLGIGKTTVNKWSKELGLYFKKHTIDKTFFDKWCEQSSYILGFILADGCISWNPEKGYYSLTITASEKDKEHLEKIRNILSSTKPLSYSSKTNSYRLIANSKVLCQKLMQIGILPRKSLNVRLPTIPEDQLRHFIRGVIDGDGNVRYLKREKSPYFEITIASGSKFFCEDLVECIRENFGIGANIRKIGKNTHVIQYSCSRGKKLANFIYLDASLFLGRKYTPYKNNVLGEE